MSSENLKIDQNHRNVAAGITDDAAQDIAILRVNPTTKRLKVELSALQPDVDVVGIGNIAGDQINPSTSDKQDDIITKIGDSLSGYKLYAIDADDATYTYFAYENKDANWYIKRMNNSTLVIDYAVGIVDIATAYTNRASQSYSLFSVNF